MIKVRMRQGFIVFVASYLRSQFCDHLLFSHQGDSEKNLPKPWDISNLLVNYMMKNTFRKSPSLGNLLKSYFASSSPDKIRKTRKQNACKQSYQTNNKNMQIYIYSAFSGISKNCYFQGLFRINVMFSKLVQQENSLLSDKS